MMVLILLIGFIVVLVGIILASNWYFNLMMGQFVGKHHHLIEEILETGRVPQRWSKKFDKKIQKLKNSGADADQIRLVRRRAMAYYAKQMDQLMRYVKGTTLVQGEDVRQDILDRLENHRANWEREYE
ncbi:MAG: hypothetical protein ACOX6S_13710 [Clostridia bacterium]|jgi:hypothetical protein